MLSIIISTVNPDFLDDLKKNIQDTIGLPYEIIAIDNTDGKKGICEVYNMGVIEARFDILCFLHEDIQIKTHDWGKKIVAHFNKDDDLGLLGVVGSTYKSSVLSGWGAYGPADRVDYANILQSYKFKNQPTEHYYYNPGKGIIKEVAVLDGVLLCSKKSILEEYPFDQDTFKGFHNYDTDISLSIGRKYKVAVIYDVLINHFSEGRFDKEWVQSTIDLHKKWKDYLPVNKAGFNEKQVIFSEKKSFRCLMPELIKWNFTLSEIITVLNLSKIRQLSPFLYFRLFCLALKKYYKVNKIYQQSND